MLRGPNADFAGPVDRVTGTEPTHDPRGPVTGGSGARPPVTVADVSDAVAAFRAYPNGGADGATQHLRVPPSWRASVSPAIAVLRWAALAYGLVFAAPMAFRGSATAIAATAVCTFVTTWRTVIPLHLGSRRPWQALEPFVDVAVVGVAVGLSGGWSSPYFFTLLVCVGVVALGWGVLRGGIGFVVACLALVVASLLEGNEVTELVVTQRDVAAIATVALGVALAAYARDRILDSDRRRSGLVDEVTHLSETNQLLEMLNVVARTLPDSLTLRDALERIRHQLIDTFDARVICLMTYDEGSEEWVPKLADGCALRPAYPRSDLPAPLRIALDEPGPATVPNRATIHRFDDLAAGDPRSTPAGSDTGVHPIVRTSRSGMYARLVARDQVIGVLGVEHPAPNRYDHHDEVLLSGLAEVVALTVDNARWFGRLRTLGAQEERIRIARDLHDRLGQWLTYVSMELERIVAQDSPGHDDLLRLQSDVQSALDELRETLRQLRSGVTDQKSLATVAQDVVNRFAERADVAASFTVVHPEDRAPVPVENELLRILQEALTNVDRHAHAEHVDVVWDVRGSAYELVVRDDGHGFDFAKGVRDSAFGLVGMRERADVIGARLVIDSSPAGGTTVRVFTGEARARTAPDRGRSADRSTTDGTSADGESKDNSKEVAS